MIRSASVRESRTGAESSKPEDSLRPAGEMAGHAGNILKRLRLPYRTMLLCSGDMEFCLHTKDPTTSRSLAAELASENSYPRISAAPVAKASGPAMHARWRNPATGNAARLLHAQRLGRPSVERWLR